MEKFVCSCHNWEFELEKKFKKHLYDIKYMKEKGHTKGLSTYIEKTSEELNRILTEEFLIEECINKNKLPIQLGKEIGCGAEAIRIRMRKFGIVRERDFSKILTKEFLEKYVDIKTPKEISQMVKCNITTVLFYLKKFDLFKDILWYPAITKEFLIVYYLNKKTPKYKIAKLVGCDVSTITDRLKKFGLPNNLRFRKRKKTSFSYPLEFHKIRKQILKRDNHICQFCGMTDEISLKKFKKRLTVHHIDFCKEHNVEHNLVTLCQKCNTKANSDVIGTSYFYWTINKIHSEGFCSLFSFV
jgi:hypothetical protein